MTKFNPENKQELKHSDCLHPAMSITDPEDAQQYLEEYTLYLFSKLPEKDLDYCIRMAKENIGYYAGYFDKQIQMIPYSVPNRRKLSV